MRLRIVLATLLVAIAATFGLSSSASAASRAAVLVDGSYYVKVNTEYGIKNIAPGNASAYAISVYHPGGIYCTKVGNVGYFGTTARWVSVAPGTVVHASMSRCR